MNLFESVGKWIDRPEDENARVSPETLDKLSHEYELEDLRVRTTVRWKDGSETSKVINWSDREAVRGWARVARAALVNGGKTICEKEEN